MNISMAGGYSIYNGNNNSVNTSANNRNPNNAGAAVTGGNANLSGGTGDASNVLDNVINPNNKNSATDKSADNSSNKSTNKNGLEENRKKIQESAKECQSCKNRRYQDGSNDASVSFKSPTKIAPGNVASAVRGHEQQHVAHEQFKAQRDERKIISQTVALHSGICPECGKTYISGGTTRTVSKSQSQAQRFNVGKNDNNSTGFSSAI